jgi:uncharacterized protein YutE (UPF0331/DUF86 family)
MKSEYLITFDAKDGICTSVDKFKSLLSAHTSISFAKKDIVYKGASFPYQLAQGKLTDGSLYYDMTLEDSSPSQQESYKELLKEVRRICTKISGRNIIVLHDGVGEEYSQQGYPFIYRTENLMRKLIAKFMAISIGYDWSDMSTPKEVLDSVRADGRKEKTNFLHEVDFIQLSNFLFKKYTKADSGKFIDSLKEKLDDDVIRVGDIKQYSPFTNWEKYFSKNVKCDSEYLRSRWEKLYEYRCKIAHCKGLSKQELDDLIQLSGEVSEKIQAALDSIGDVHVEEAEREELAENFSGTANKSAAEFIARYNKLLELTRLACEVSSDDQDVYGKYETNKTNIRMQSSYLCNAKGAIDKDAVALINRAQQFRNKVVHRVGIVEIGESELIEEIQSIDSVIDVLSALQKDDLEKLKGVNLRSDRASE